MYGYQIQQSRDQTGKVANSARGQLNRENEYFPVPVLAGEYSLARRVRPSSPTSGCLFSTLRLNLVLTHGIPPDFRGGVHVFIQPLAIGSVPSLSGLAIAYIWRSPPRVRRQRASSLMVVPVTGAAFAGHHVPINIPIFSHTHYTIISMKRACSKYRRRLYGYK